MGVPAGGCPVGGAGVPTNERAGASFSIFMTAAAPTRALLSARRQLGDDGGLVGGHVGAGHVDGYGVHAGQAERDAFVAGRLPETGDDEVGVAVQLALGLVIAERAP